MKENRSLGMVILIVIIFFVISLLTNIINAVLPHVKESYSLTHGLAGLLPFAFFIAYGVMSIPSGMMVKKFNRKTMLVFPFGLACMAALLFGLLPYFPVYLISLFSIGVGMAMLQVVINPVLRAAGGEEHFAVNSVIAQLFFSGAGYVDPHIYSYLVASLKDHSIDKNFIINLISKVTPEHLSWVSIYWVFVVITAMMVIIIAVLKIPKIQLKSDEKVGAWEVHKQMFQKKVVLLYFIGIFCYVGSEQGIGNWISEFLKNYHNVNPETVGASVVANFWLVFTIGCGVGVIVLKMFDSKNILKIASVLAIISLTVSLFGPVSIVTYSFPAVGFFYSVMWSIIFSLALNSVPKEHGTFSGILCTGIIGGAIVPAVIGWLADYIGLRFGMMFMYVTLGYIFSIGFWSKPLIKNKTIFE